MLFLCGISCWVDHLSPERSTLALKFFNFVGACGRRGEPYIRWDIDAPIIKPMICPICQRNMFENIAHFSEEGDSKTFHLCIDCMLSFYENIGDMTNTYSYKGQFYPKIEFERKCKLQIFW